MTFRLLANIPKPRVPALSIGITGHRPDKLGGYDFGNPTRKRLREEVRKATEALIQSARRDGMDAGFRNRFLKQARWQNGWEIDEKWRTIEVLCLHGGAQGADQDAAAEWYRMGLPYVVVAPFPGQDHLWPRESQARFRKVLEYAAGVYLVSDTAPTNRHDASKMLLQRNVTLCQMSDELIAVWDGSSGGTAHCVNWWIGVSLGAHLTHLDPQTWKLVP